MSKRKVEEGCAQGTPFGTKKECEDATGQPAKRCHRCRQWHATGTRLKKGRPTRGKRTKGGRPR